MPIRLICFLALFAAPVFGAGSEVSSIGLQTIHPNSGSAKYLQGQQSTAADYTRVQLFSSQQKQELRSADLLVDPTNYTQPYIEYKFKSSDCLSDVEDAEYVSTQCRPVAGTYTRYFCASGRLPVSLD